MWFMVITLYVIGKKNETSKQQLKRYGSLYSILYFFCIFQIFVVFKSQFVGFPQKIGLNVHKNICRYITQHFNGAHISYYI